jgi:hypothetical protein
MIRPVGLPEEIASPGGGGGGSILGASFGGLLRDSLSGEPMQLRVAYIDRRTPSDSCEEFIADKTLLAITGNDFRTDVYLLSPGSAVILFVFDAKITPAHAVEYKRPVVLWSAASG